MTDTFMVRDWYQTVWGPTEACMCVDSNVKPPGLIAKVGLCLNCAHCIGRTVSNERYKSLNDPWIQWVLTASSTGTPVGHSQKPTVRNVLSCFDLMKNLLKLIMRWENLPDDVEVSTQPHRTMIRMQPVPSTRDLFSRQTESWNRSTFTKTAEWHWVIIRTATQPFNILGWLYCPVPNFWRFSYFLWDGWLVGLQQLVSDRSDLAEY